MGKYKDTERTNAYFFLFFCSTQLYFIMSTVETSCLAWESKPRQVHTAACRDINRETKQSKDRERESAAKRHKYNKYGNKMNRRHIMSYITGIELLVKSELSFIILQAHYTPA